MAAAASRLGALAGAGVDAAHGGSSIESGLNGLPHRQALGRFAMNTITNAINVIAPYKYHGLWVFDDPRVGLVQEPFVAGADAMIDRVVAGLPDAEHGFTMIFASTPFPGHQFRLDWRRNDGGGNCTMPNSSTWRVGSVPPCCAIPPSRRNICTCKSRPRDDMSIPA
jgi:hypothetical protein